MSPEDLETLPVAELLSALAEEIDMGIRLERWDDLNEVISNEDFADAGPLMQQALLVLLVGAKAHLKGWDAAVDALRKSARARGDDPEIVVKGLV